MHAILTTDRLGSMFESSQSHQLPKKYNVKFLPYFYWPVWYLPSLSPPLRLRLIPQLMLGTDTMAMDMDMADTDMVADTTVDTTDTLTDTDTTEASVMPKLTPLSLPPALP